MTRKGGSRRSTAFTLRRLPGRCARWLDGAPVLATTRRPMTPGDVLILVRSRGELASLIVARLFAEGVPVAGIDRLHLSKPLAVRDLLAAIGFVVQPLDDLTLANLLVSPLIGWDQDQLYDLAFGRNGSAVAARWSRGRARAATSLTPMTSSARCSPSPISRRPRASSKPSSLARSTAAANCSGAWAWRRATRSMN